MSWSPLLPDTRAPIQKLKPAVSASVSAGEGRTSPRLTISLRPAQLDGVTWLQADAGLQVLVGHAEHAGMLRIMPNGLHILGRIALAKPEGSVLALRLPLPAWLVRGARPAAALEHEWQEGWIEVTLPPEWRGAAAPAPKGTPERAKQLAAEAAAAVRQRAGL